MDQLSWIEIEPLAAHICGLDEEATPEEIELELADKFDISMEAFETIIQKLFRMLDYSVSPLTSTPMIGFGSGTEWIITKVIPDTKFIPNLIQWITDGDQPDKGFVKPIINGKVVEYNLYLIKSEFKVKISKDKD
jgi:hypothetical protein